MSLLFDILFIAFIVVAVIVAALYFFSKWASKKFDQQQTLIKNSRTTATIFVISKKRDKAKNVKLPKVIMEQMPRMAKLMNMYFVQAKIGAQITTLICEKAVFNALPLKKNVKVGIAGIYIVDMPGMKTEKQIKQERKEKKAAAKKAAAAK